jgi:hypothetical protein
MQYEMFFVLRCGREFNYVTSTDVFCCVCDAKTSFNTIFPRIYRKFLYGSQETSIMISCNAFKSLMKMYNLIQVEIRLSKYAVYYR